MEKWMKQTRYSSNFSNWILFWSVWNILSVQIIFKDFRRKRYPPSCKICKIRRVTVSPSRSRGQRLITLITGRVINLLNDTCHRTLIIRCNNCSTGVHTWQVRNLHNYANYRDVDGTKHRFSLPLLRPISFEKRNILSNLIIFQIKIKNGKFKMMDAKN